MRTQRLEEALAQNRVCPHCGAPITSEICSYCGTNVADFEEMTSELVAEYPTAECHMARFSFFGTIFPLTFMLSFVFFGIMFPFIFVATGNAPKTVILRCLPFALVGIGAGIVFFRNISRVVMVNTKGKVIDAIVYGYMDDTVAYNGNNGQVVKLLISTPQGKRFIFLSLEATNKPYKINSTIKLKHYKNLYKIMSEDVWE